MRIYLYKVFGRFQRATNFVRLTDMSDGHLFAFSSEDIKDHLVLLEAEFGSDFVATGFEKIEEHEITLLIDAKSAATASIRGSAIRGGGSSMVRE